MKPSVCRRLMAGVALLTMEAAAGSALAQGQPSRWWKSEKVIKELGLTVEQSSRIEKVFEGTLPELRVEMEELNRLETKLSRLIDADAEETALTRQIDRVETARANLSKTRTLMLLQMRRILTPEQRERLKVMQEKRANHTPGHSERGASPPPG
jgi:Spy/CpxP family protein refolding chaperone